MLLVTGTMVTTPRPRRAAVALARSLLTTTAGRCLVASLPRTGSTSTRNPAGFAGLGAVLILIAV